MSGSGRLLEKVAVISGGTSGIGRATALRFALEGARVVVSGRDAEAGRATVSEIERRGGHASWTQADVTADRQVAALIQSAERQYGRVDVVVGSAGVLETGTVVEMSEESWSRVLDINLGGQFRLAKHAIPALQRAGGGSLILTASELGLVGARAMAAYCAAKAGVINLVRALAVDCAPMGIRVNCLAPGAVDTPLLQRWLADAIDPSEAQASQIDPIPMARLGAPEEIAGASVFLASDDASYMTGAVLLLDGGVTASYGL